jgi:outer membrane protein
MRRAAFVWIAAVTAAAAAETGEGEPARPRVELHASVGAAAVVWPRPYDGAGSSVYALPIASLSYGRLWMTGVTVGYRAVGGRRGGIDVFVRPRLDGYDAGDSTALRGMADREWSADVGIGVSRRRERLELDLTATTDLLDRHEGTEVAFEAGFPFRAGGWRLVPAAAVAWQGEDLVDYYYGVRPEEELPDRPAYRAGAAFTGRARLSASRRIGDSRWSFVANATLERPGEEIRDSPIVDASTAAGGYAGFLYRLRP